MCKNLKNKWLHVNEIVKISMSIWYSLIKYDTCGNFYKKIFFCLSKLLNLLKTVKMSK